MIATNEDPLIMNDVKDKKNERESRINKHYCLIYLYHTKQ